VQCANGLDAARNWQRGPGDLSLGRMAVPSAVQRPHTPTEQRDWHALTAAVRPRYLPGQSNSSESTLVEAKVETGVDGKAWADDGEDEARG
jgi:hypothetical protein